MTLQARKTSVIVCAYTLDRWEGLVDAIRSLQLQEPPPLEVIVVIDHNGELLRKARQLDGCRVIANDRGRGLSGARNSGLAAARGDIVAFMDDDARAQPAWIGTLTAAFGDESVIGAGGTVVPQWETRRPPWFPPAFDWVVGCTYQGYPTQEGRVRNVLGCNMAFRREHLASVGGFRTELGRQAKMLFGVEETEACIRLSQRWPDATILHIPAAIVYHTVPTSRTTWNYFRRRCFGEGVSKAVLSGMVGSSQALETERRYTRSVLPAAMFDAMSKAIRQRRAGFVVRAAAVMAGLMITAAGYGWGLASRRTSLQTR